jgi:hypothetical protein
VRFSSGSNAFVFIALTFIWSPANVLPPFSIPPPLWFHQMPLPAAGASRRFPHCRTFSIAHTSGHFWLPSNELGLCLQTLAILAPSLNSPLFFLFCLLLFLPSPICFQCSFHRDFPPSFLSLYASLCQEQEEREREREREREAKMYSLG